jgi:hypothetical protein
MNYVLNSKLFAGSITACLLVFCSLTSSISATTYYLDATNGSDAKTGRSTTTAWKSLSKINSSGFVPGDSILFKRGETFRGFLFPASNGSSTGYITFGAYGSGPKPKLYGSYNAMAAAEWTTAGGNIWKITIPAMPASWVPNDVGNIIFNNEAFCGVKELVSSEVNSQGKFWVDTAQNQLWLYSTVNPALYYSNIELALDRTLVNQDDRSYLIYENLDMRYAGAHGFGGGSTHHLWLKDLDISFIGGGIQAGTTRFGNGIEFWENAHDNIVERCRITQCYDAAVTAQGQGPAAVYNLYWRNNIISSSEYIFEFFEYDKGSNTHDLYFENNTCFGAGIGWGHVQRPDSGRGSFLQFWGNLAGQSASICVRNNIFQNSIRYAADIGNGIDKYTIDYNCWYSSPPMSFQINSNKYNVSTQWAAYKTASAEDAHSIAGNPLLNTDTMPGVTSPCVNSGMTLTEVTEDFRRVTRPQGSGYDMGAYELIPVSGSAHPSAVSPSSPIAPLAENQRLYNFRGQQIGNCKARSLSMGALIRANPGNHPVLLLKR